MGWLGLDGALVTLEVTGLRCDVPGIRAGIATAMAALVGWVLMPVVLISLTSGLTLALGTSWAWCGTGGYSPNPGSPSC